MMPNSKLLKQTPAQTSRSLRCETNTRQGRANGVHEGEQRAVEATRTPADPNCGAPLSATFTTNFHNTAPCAALHGRQPPERPRRRSALLHRTNGQQKEARVTNRMQQTT